MNSISFTVPGPPRGKGRPRFARRGQYVTTYTDDKTASYENLVRMAYAQAGGHMHADCEAEVTIHAMFAIPKSMPRGRRALAEIQMINPITKPDIDNVVKAVLDGLNGSAFEDDKQVTKLYVKKLYSKEPRLEIEIAFYDQEVKA